MKPDELTIDIAQHRQPWTVPYSKGVVRAASEHVPHILASHNCLHAAKTVGKLATVFEAMDHTGGTPTTEQLATIRNMAADLMTEALRFANLYGFNLSEALMERVTEKNGAFLA